MDEKLKTYYSLIDAYSIDKKDHEYSYSQDSIEVEFLKEFKPINISILMIYVTNIINKMCKEFIYKEKVQKEIIELKNKIKNLKINIQKEYIWKDVSLNELIKGDYDYLKKKFIFRVDYVPDNNTFINKFTYPATTLSYDFSIRELYNALLDRGINIAIKNYYIKNKQ